MNCEQVPVALLRAADGELEQEEGAAMEAHVKECAACSAAQELFRQTERNLSACGEALDHQTTMPIPAGRGPHPVWALAALTVLAVLTLVLWAPRSRPLAPSAASALDELQTIRVELPLSAIGDPFLNDSESEPPVKAEVVVGADGLPQDVRLAF